MTLMGRVCALFDRLRAKGLLSWLLTATLLRQSGAIANRKAGSRELTWLGVLGAVVAIALVAALKG